MSTSQHEMVTLPEAAAMLGCKRKNAARLYYAGVLKGELVRPRKIMVTVSSVREAQTGEHLRKKGPKRLSVWLIREIAVVIEETDAAARELAGVAPDYEVTLLGAAVPRSKPRVCLKGSI